MILHRDCGRVALDVTARQAHNPFRLPMAKSSHSGGVAAALAVAAVAVAFAQTPGVARHDPRPAKAAGRLSAADVEQAIALGTTGSPVPYLLHHRSGSGRVNAVVVGLVYTPFVRVALAAHAAATAGRTFTQDDLTADLTEPIVYVAFRWYGGIDPALLPDTAAAFAAADYKIAMAGDRDDRRMQGQLAFPPPPLWTSRDLSLLRRFGAERPYRDIALIAAYPAAVITPNVSFAIYKEWPSASVPGGVDAFMEEGLVTANDVAAWR
jgi:hypothetical protein